MYTSNSLISKTLHDLREMRFALKKEQFFLRFQLSSGALKNTAQMKENKKNFARVMTRLSSLKKSDSLKKNSEKKKGEVN